MNQTRTLDLLNRVNCMRYRYTQVDDTVSGVGEGLNAGCWSVGVAAYSNYTDVDSIQQWDEMAENEKEKRRQVSRWAYVKKRFSCLSRLRTGKKDTSNGIFRCDVNYF